MSTNVEDLYLKGFMAFSAKNYESAKAYWEQVLAVDPSHEKAKKGLADLSAGAAKPRKKSSKEVFQDIKRLYGEKNFAEALRLCNLLLKKHPDNTDLQGLQKKLEARVKQASGAAPAAQQAPPAAKSTMFMASAAEASVDEDTGADKAALVEKHIKDGVGLYELNDFAAAIKAWEKALALDPDNRIARDYITNVKSQMEPESEAEAPEPSPESNRPGKDDMIRIYNEAMAHYKEGDYQQALDKWESILKFYPTHAETLQCVERTRQMMKTKQEESLVEEARGHLSSGNISEAERLATQLAITAPDTPGLDQLQADIRKAQQPAEPKVKGIDTLEIDTPAVSPREVIRPDIEEDHHESHSASEDQLGEFFNEPKDASQKARQVSKVLKAKRERKPLNLKLIVGVPVTLIVLSVGGWFGWDFYNKQLKTSDEGPIILLNRDVHWNSPEQQTIDFVEFGNEFADSGDALLASIAYQRVIDIAEPRLAALQRSDPATNPEIAQETERIQEALETARTGLSKAMADLKPADVTDKDMERARGELDRERFQDAVERLHRLLSNDRDNAHLRDMLGDTHEKLAFQSLRNGELDSAYESFKRATVLQSGNDRSRHHTEVINRFYQGKIEASDKDQWFFFFLN
ncbi:MAG: tetratricopeptide repeat protein [Acidobacteriota bacterium]|nr:tetratricopeptide repeat protein [Acidobacteriota bacterium]